MIAGRDSVHPVVVTRDVELERRVAVPDPGNMSWRFCDSLAISELLYREAAPPTGFEPVLPA